MTFIKKNEGNFLKKLQIELYKITLDFSLIEFSNIAHKYLCINFRINIEKVLKFWFEN